MRANPGHEEPSRVATPRRQRASNATALKRVSLKPISRGNRRSSVEHVAEQGRAIEESEKRVVWMKALWRHARLEYHALKCEGDGELDGPASLPYAADAITAAVGALRRRRSKFATLVDCSWLHEITEKKLNQRIRSRLEASVHPRELDLLMEGIVRTWKELLILQCQSFVKACAILTAAFFSERVLVGQADEWRANLRSKLNKLVVFQDDDVGIHDRVEMLTGIVARAETIKSLLDRTARSFAGGSFRWARNYCRDLHATRRASAIQEREALEAALASAKASGQAGATEARRVSLADIFARQAEQENKLAEKRRRRGENIGLLAGHRHDVQLLDTLPDLSNKFPCALEWQPFHDSYRDKSTYCRPPLMASSDPRERAVPLKPPSVGKDGRQAQRPRSAMTAGSHGKGSPPRFTSMDQDQPASAVAKQMQTPDHMAHLGAGERFEGG